MGSYLSLPARSGSIRSHAGGETATPEENKAVPKIAGVAKPANAAPETYKTPDSSPQEVEKWDQCGLEDDKDQWVVWQGPQRIKTCQLTADERTKFKGILNQIFSRNCLLGKRIPISPEDIEQVVDKVIPYLKSEPMLIEDVPFDITIVGDLHGQLFDLNRVFEHDAKDGKPGWECKKYLFLGDYVDRGRQSLEIVIALFIIKMLHPNDIFLLRGNHEFMMINLKYGLAEEIGDRYEEPTAEFLFFLLNEAMCWLSVAAIVGNSYFCAHAGISPAGFTRRQMRGIYKPYCYSGEDILVHDIVWSDPAKGLTGTIFNVSRLCSHYFGLDTLIVAMERMEVLGVFRGHTHLANGRDSSWKSLHAIFTATNYGDTMSKGAVAVVDVHGKVSFLIMKPDKERAKWERKLRVMDGKSAEQAVDPVTQIDDVNETGSLMNMSLLIN